MIRNNDLSRNFLDVSGGGQLPLECTFWDRANNSVTFGPIGVPIRGVVIDAHPPSIVSASLYHYSSSPARIGANITIALVANEPSLLPGCVRVRSLCLRGLQYSSRSRAE